jgi:hypothetical protein
MTPLYRLLSSKLPRRWAVAALAVLYSAMLFGVLLAGSYGIEHNVYVDVKGKR